MSDDRKTSESPDDGTRSVPTTSNDIDAEIADHLATAAERLQAQGASPTDARAQAQSEFGDAATVRRSCHWIQHGDSLMFRGAVIALLSILCLGLMITAVASWRTQARMAEQMTALTEQLKSLAERPAVAAPAPPAVEAQTEVKPLEFQGQAFVGTADRAAANKSLAILSVADGQIARRITTDAGGKFQSGPLPAGDYALVASLENFDRGEVQTAPILLYPGAPLAALTFDVGYPTGRIKIEVSRALPQNAKEGQFTIESRLLIKVATQR